MKYRLLCILPLIALMGSLTAQAPLTITPAEIEVEGVALPDDFHEIIGYATVKNVSNDTINLKWTRVIIDMPDAWESQICDLNFCFLPIVYSNFAPDLGLESPVPLAPGGETNMDVHILPKGVAGTAEIRIDLSTEEEPSTILASGTYRITATPATSTRQAARTRLTAFPNPTADYIQLRGAEEVSRIVLYNVLGKEVRSFNAAMGGRYYIGDLPNGMYLASLINNQKGVITTLRISKRSAQP
jgi:hypothetical protein